MIRLRVAGGLVASQWVPIRVDRRGGLHAIVEAHHWPVEAQDIIVDVDLEDSTVDLEEVLHRLISRRHAEHRDDEDEEMHAAVSQAFEEKAKSQTKPQTATSTAAVTDRAPFKRSRAAGPAPRTRAS